MRRPDHQPGHAARGNRIPPRQVQTRKWPVLHAGEVPDFDPATWDFTIFPVPLVDQVKRFTWAGVLRAAAGAGVRRHALRHPLEQARQHCGRAWRRRSCSTT